MRQKAWVFCLATYQAAFWQSFSEKNQPTTDLIAAKQARGKAVCNRQAVLHRGSVQLRPLGIQQLLGISVPQSPTDLEIKTVGAAQDTAAAGYFCPPIPN